MCLCGRVHRSVSKGGQQVKKLNHHVTKRSSADCSLWAEALTAGPAVWLHPSDASDSLYGSRPKATAHKGWYTTEIFALFWVILYWSLKGECLFFLPASPHTVRGGGHMTGSDTEHHAQSWARAQCLAQGHFSRFVVLLRLILDTVGGTTDMLKG